MSLLYNLNFVATLIAFYSASFAASNFGIKLGRLTSFKNTSGYEYISSSNKSDLLYEDIAKVAKEEKDAPNWAKEKEKLKAWCKRNENSIINWKYASKYCLIKNNVKHQLIKDGYALKSTSNGENSECKEILEMYSDNTQSSLGYLLGRSKCFDAPSTTSGSVTA